jgi:hypothetical protein
MAELKWHSQVDVRELQSEPKLTEKADFLFASHVDSGALADMIRFVLSQPEQDRGRFVLTCGERILYRREIENLAARPDFPGADRYTVDPVA